MVKSVRHSSQVCHQPLSTSPMFLGTSPCSLAPALPHQHRIVQTSHLVQAKPTTAVQMILLQYKWYYCSTICTAVVQIVLQQYHVYYCSTNCIAVLQMVLQQTGSRQAAALATCPSPLCSQQAGSSCCNPPLQPASRQAAGRQAAAHATCPSPPCSQQAASRQAAAAATPPCSRPADRQ